MHDKIQKALSQVKKYSGIVAVIIIPAAFFLVFLFSTAESMIYFADGTHSDGQIFVAGRSFVCGLVDPGRYTSPEEAQLSTVTRRPACLAFSEVIRIDFTFPADEIEAPDAATDAVPAGNNMYNPGYLGRYSINVSGHQGVLVIDVTNGVLWGAVHFPNWAKGQVEYLKYVAIQAMFCILSAQRPQSKKSDVSVASRTFTQQFTGSYIDNGRTIRGSFLNNGVSQSWEARRAD
jgi:hypothetical protein